MTTDKTTDDVTSTEERVTKLFGMKPHLAASLIDEFGPRYVTAACDKVEDDMAAGANFHNPSGILISMLRSGEIQALLARQAEVAEPDANLDVLRDRIHMVLSDPIMDCPQKQLARRPLPPEFEYLAAPPTVRCPCGCKQTFTAIVEGRTNV